MPLKAQPQKNEKTGLSQRPSQQTSQNCLPSAHQTHPDKIFRKAQLAPSTLTQQDLMHLQNTSGNRAVGTFLTQTKNTSQSKSLPEAQRKLTENSFGIAVQRQSTQEENDGVKGNFTPFKSLAQLQNNRDESENHGRVETVTPIQKKQKNGGNLPDEVQLKMENSFGTDFSDVKVHENSTLAKDLNAKAYTQGNEIHFAPGEYSPGTTPGQEILSHELSHVIQHRQGKVKTTHQEKGYDVSDQIELESEADKHSKIAVSGGKIGGISQLKNQPQSGSIQKKSAPLQLFRSLPSGATILGINPDMSNIYLACSHLASRVENRVGRNVHWPTRIGQQLEGSIAANRLVPIRSSFTETEGINFDWTVSINWRINNPTQVGGDSTSKVTRSGGGSVSSSSTTSSSSTDSAGISGSVGGHEGAPGAGAEAGTSSTQGSSQTQGVSLQGGVSREGNERAQTYTAGLVANITVSGSANFSGSDYVNPFKWGTSLGSEITTNGPQSGSYAAGTIDYQDSRPV